LSSRWDKINKLLEKHKDDRYWSVPTIVDIFTAFSGQKKTVSSHTIYKLGRSPKSIGGGDDPIWAHRFLKPIIDSVNEGTLSIDEAYKRIKDKLLWQHAENKLASFEKKTGFKLPRLSAEIRHEKKNTIEDMYNKAEQEIVKNYG
jgi:hypothetical protein